MISCKKKYFSNLEKAAEYKRIVGVEPVINEENFIKLLLVLLADQSKEHYLNSEGCITQKAELPFDYREAIDYIMYQDNASSRYEDVIDLGEYYYNNNVWKRNMFEGISKFLDSFKGSYYYNFTDRTLMVYFTYTDRMKIKNEFDPDIVSTMRILAYSIENYFKEQNDKSKKKRR